MTLTAVTNEQVKAGIVQGNRPPLNSVKGSADLVSFAKKWIPLCWHKSPKDRPTFDCKHYDIDMYIFIQYLLCIKHLPLCIV